MWLTGLPVGRPAGRRFIVRNRGAETIIGSAWHFVIANRNELAQINTHRLPTIDRCSLINPNQILIKRLLNKRTWAYWSQVAIFLSLSLSDQSRKRRPRQARSQALVTNEFPYTSWRGGGPISKRARVEFEKLLKQKFFFVAAFHGDTNNMKRNRWRRCRRRKRRRRREAPMEEQILDHITPEKRKISLDSKLIEKFAFHWVGRLF